MDFTTDYIITHSSKILAVFAIIFGGFVLQSFICRLFSYFSNRQFISGAVFQISKRTARWLIFFFVFLFLLQQFGISVSAIFTSILTVVTLVAIGFFAIWSVLSNFLCSFLLIVFSPFRIGDEIEICEVVGGEGLRGQVVDFNIMYTSILEWGEMAEEEKALIRIPNNIFFQKAIKRWKGPQRKSIEKHLLKKSIME